MVSARCAYRFHHCGRRRGIRADSGAVHHRALCVVVVRSLLRLVRERDPFIRLAGTGLACMFGVQAMINMGVAVRLLPAKGMTLPFVSYGGSSVIASALRWACCWRLRAHGRRAKSAILRAGAQPMKRTTFDDRGGRHGRAYVPGAGLGRGDVGTGLAGQAVTDARGARYTGGFPASVEIETDQQRHLCAGRVVGQSAGAVSHCAACWARVGDDARQPDVVVGFGGYPRFLRMARRLCCAARG